MASESCQSGKQNHYEDYEINDLLQELHLSL